MALYTPSTNTNPLLAKYGEKSTGTSSLQQQLNTLGAGLKVDSLYGPKTQEAYNKYKSQLNQTSVDKPLGENFNMPGIKSNPDEATTPQVDENKIRSDILSQFQDRIDSLNAIYDEQKRKAGIEGQSRVGSGTALLAARGLTGTQRGETVKGGIVDENRAVQNSIDAERGNAIGQIMGTVSELAVTEAKNRREALEKGAKAHLDYLSNRDDIRKENLNTVAAAFLAQGIDPNELEDKQLTTVLKNLGATKGELLSSYTSAKSIPENQTKPLTLSQGQSAYTYDPSTGKYTQVANNPKTYSSGGASSTIGNYNLTSKEQSALQKVVDSYTKDTVVNQGQNAQQVYNLVSTIDANPTNAGNQLIALYTLVKNLDPNSAVREGEIDLATKTNSYLGKFGTTLSRIYEGRIISPAATKELTKATKTLADEWVKSGSRRQKQYESQANVFGLKDPFNAYLQGFAPIESPPQDTNTGFSFDDLSPEQLAELQNEGLISH